MQLMDFFLKICQESADMGTVHLGVMELKGDGQGIPEELPAVSAPDHERVVEDAAVHAHGPVDLGVDDGGGADDHTGFRQIPVLAAFCHLSGIGQIIPVEDCRLSEYRMSQELTSPALFFTMVFTAIVSYCIS